MLNLFGKKKDVYRNREEWSYFMPMTSEERKKKLKALRNQRYYDKHRR